jgi:hypothetical protein
MEILEFLCALNFLGLLLAFFLLNRIVETIWHLQEMEFKRLERQVERLEDRK